MILGTGESLLSRSYLTFGLNTLRLNVASTFLIFVAFIPPVKLMYISFVATD